jgi:tartrate dehydratase alpha subunit/fumarate hydratase class I-like protein
MTAQSNYRPTLVEPALSQKRSDEQSRSLSDLVIDHFEIMNSSRGEVKIVVVNKGGGSSGTSTLRLIVLKAGRLGQKEAATVFAKVPALASGQTTFIFVKAGVPISKRKHAISIDISEDSK